MPCNQVALNEVEIGAANSTLLHCVLANLISKGELSLRVLRARDVISAAEDIIRQGFIRLPAGQEFLADRIKQEYSRQAIQLAAQKFSWRIQENPRAKNKMTATRRV